MPDGIVHASLTTEVRGGHQFTDVAKALRNVANRDDRRSLQSAMNREIRTAGRPVVVAVRRAALAIPDLSPARRRDNRSIRAEIANAVRMQILTGSRNPGVRILCEQRRLPEDSRGMAASFEGRRGWRHPVFPRHDQTRTEWTWVHQPGHPWFRPTARNHDDEFRRAVVDAVKQTAAAIDRAAGR